MEERMILRETAAVRLEHLTKRFGPVIAVNDVSLEIPAGMLICLLGPSGCGKTTTLRLIGGFEEPTQGHVYIGGQCVDHLPPYQRPTAMVFQSYALFPHMTVYDNIAYGLKAHHVPKREQAKRVRWALELLELDGQEDKFPRQLSGGQQQRVALARALVVEPKVLLLDEPLSNLDAQLRVRVRAEIRALQRKLGITTIYVTHDQEEAFSISDITAVMNAGRLEQVGTPLDLYKRPRSLFVAQFVGLSNILEAEVVGMDGGMPLVRGLGQLVRVAEVPQGLGAKVHLVLRPEMIALLPDGAEGLPATVKTVAFTGAWARYRLSVAEGKELIVDVPNPSETGIFPEGTTAIVQFPKEVPSCLIE